MKVFAFIMAFLVLALTCLPCADNELATGSDKVKTESAKIPQQNNDDHNDDCSPFCNCSCCACFSLNHISTIITDPFINDSRALISHLPASISEMSFPVWEPPQLS